MTPKRPVRVGRKRRYPRTEIVPLVRPRFTYAEQFDAMKKFATITPTRCTASWSSNSPDSKYALPGFQFCALRHNHDGPCLVDSWDGSRRFWVGDGVKPTYVHRGRDARTWTGR